MAQASARWMSRSEHDEAPPKAPRAIAPHAPSSRDLIGLYAARVQATGADLRPALRDRRAAFSGSPEPVGYLAAACTVPSCPVPVGRGTATHRQALEALAEAQWATRPGWLPTPDPVRVTRSAGARGGRGPVPLDAYADGRHPASWRPGLLGRVSAAAAALTHRNTHDRPVVDFERLPRLDPRTA